MERLKYFAAKLVLLLTLIASAGLTAAQTLELWTFVNTHARWFREMAERYRDEINPDFTLNITEFAGQALFDRLRVSLQSGGIGAPDIADIEQGAFGSFLRGEQAGLLDLRPLLEGGGHLENLVTSRQALYSFGDAVYGIEHALTPVVLYYRVDVWEEAGIDPNTLETWNDFSEAAKVIAQQGAVSLPVFPALHQILLRQRGSDLFDAEGNVALDSDHSIDTMEWILQQIDLGIAEPIPGTGGFPTSPPDFAAFRDGRFVAIVGADWYGGFLIDNLSEFAGLWRAAPLPAWEIGGRRTSVAGGTGATIVATSPHKEEAWRFLEFAMLSVEGNVRRFELTNLYPPYIPSWMDERLQRSVEYFGGQNLGALFAEIGAEAPPQYQSPYRTQLQELFQASFEDIIQRVQTPEQVFRRIANTIRREMELDQ